MISFDTNVLFYALNSDSVFHKDSKAIISKLSTNSKVAICELVLVELYILLRNTKIMSKPLSAKEAVEVINVYRNNPRWRVIESAPIMDELWDLVAKHNFSRIRIFDLRLGLTLKHHQVKELITYNIKDFKEVNFEKVISPTEALAIVP